MFVLVAITENPYTEKRNALGPVYLGLILVLFQNWFASRTRRLVLLVLGMVLAFPAIAVFTQNHNAILGQFSMDQFGSQIADHYFSINYDSWANIYTSVEIVRVHGLQWGHQLLGSMLFFVPSSLWTSKPLATGIFLGNYLIAHYSMWFTNLSAPLVAEGYLDFGYVGVVAYAAGMAYFVTFLNTLARRRDKWAALPMATYASVFLMIVLRGSLMIAMGFGVAAFLSFGLASAMLSVNFGGAAILGVPAGKSPAGGPAFHWDTGDDTLRRIRRTTAAPGAWILECLRNDAGALEVQNAGRGVRSSTQARRTAEVRAAVYQALDRTLPAASGGATLFCIWRCPAVAAKSSTWAMCSPASCSGSKYSFIITVSHTSIHRPGSANACSRWFAGIPMSC